MSYHDVYHSDRTNLSLRKQKQLLCREDSGPERMHAESRQCLQSQTAFFFFFFFFLHVSVDEVPNWDHKLSLLEVLFGSAVCFRIHNKFW